MVHHIMTEINIVIGLTESIPTDYDNYEFVSVQTDLKNKVQKCKYRLTIEAYNKTLKDKAKYDMNQCVKEIQYNERMKQRAIIYEQAKKIKHIATQKRRHEHNIVSKFNYHIKYPLSNIAKLKKTKYLSI